MKHTSRLLPVFAILSFASGSALAAAQYGEGGAPFPMVEDLVGRAQSSAIDHRKKAQAKTPLKLKAATDEKATAPKLSAEQKRRLRHPR
jgi:hypothetical protein